MSTEQQSPYAVFAGSPLAKRVFISHSRHDDAIGKRLCAALESHGIACWYSSRPSDLEPGVEWDDSIVAALDNSIAVVLLFSASANASKWVKRELTMAERRDVPVYPLRIEDIWPTGGMEAHLVSVQWTDAFLGPFESHLGPILSKLLSHFPPQTARPSEDQSSTRRRENLPPASDGPAETGASSPNPDRTHSSEWRGKEQDDYARSAKIVNRIVVFALIAIIVLGVIMISRHSP
jgi:hypothetical protein